MLPPSILLKQSFQKPRTNCSVLFFFFISCLVNFIIDQHVTKLCGVTIRGEMRSGMEDMNSWRIQDALDRIIELSLVAHSIA